MRVDESRYRQAERTLWDAVGVEPDDRTVHLAELGTDVRVQEVDGGPPVLFVHGAPNAGSTWATVAARLNGFRLLIPDRPGAGLSSPLAHPVTLASAPEYGDRFAVELLDALGVDRADVVASSFGGYLALRARLPHLRPRACARRGCSARWPRRCATFSAGCPPTRAAPPWRSSRSGTDTPSPPAPSRPRR